MDSTEGVVVLEETKRYGEVEVGEKEETDDEGAQIVEEKFTIVKGKMNEEMIEKFFNTDPIWDLPLNKDDDDGGEEEKAMPALVGEEDEIVKLKSICDACKEEGEDCKCDKQ